MEGPAVLSRLWISEDPQNLLLQDGFGEVARLVYVDPALNG